MIDAAGVYFHCPKNSTRGDEGKETAGSPHPSRQLEAVTPSLTNVAD